LALVGTACQQCDDWYDASEHEYSGNRWGDVQLLLGEMFNFYLGRCSTFALYRADLHLASPT
jgi:hypothetical protein